MMMKGMWFASNSEISLRYCGPKCSVGHLPRYNSMKAMFVVDVVTLSPLTAAGILIVDKNAVKYLSFDLMKFNI